MSRNLISKKQKMSGYVLWRVLPLAVIAMAAIGLLVLSRTEITVKETVNERIKHQSNYIFERVDQRFKTIHDELALLAENDLILNGLIDAESRNLYLPTFFVSLRLGGRFEARISLLDYKARELFHNGLSGGPSVDRKEWIDALAEGKEIHYFDLDGILIAIPVMVHGYAEGAIVASFEPDMASRIFDTGTAGIGIDVINGEGVTLYSSSDLLEEHRHDDETDGLIEIHHAIPFFEGFQIVTSRHESEAYRTIHQLREFLIYSGLASLLALIAAIVFSTYLSSRELSNLSSLLGSITRAEHFNKRVKSKGPEEVQALGEAFNSMLETLQHTTTSSSYLDNILNSLNEILIVTTQGGEIVTLNQEAERFLESRNLSRETNIALAIRADCYGVDQDPWQFLRVVGGSKSLEGIYTSPDKPMKALLWTKSPVLDDDGFEAGVAYVATDITERMQMDQMKTEFVSTVSHELRTPLTSILGSIKLVQSGAAGEISDNAGDMLSIAHNNSERLIRLINDILDVQKIEAGQMVMESDPVELRSHIEKSLSDNQSYAEQYGVSYVNSLPDEDVWIMADGHRLDQVLANLMSNAAKFSNRGSDVHVELCRSGDSVIISVEDSGAGIPESHRESIFEKFKQVDASDSRSKGGTGLGLAITRDLVKLMNGEIWFESALGEGTTFYIRFPELIRADEKKSISA